MLIGNANNLTVQVLVVIIVNVEVDQSFYETHKDLECLLAS